MRTGEEVPKKLDKADSSSQEVPATPAYPDWSSSMQAFYGSGASPTFFPSTLASPSMHPYIWGSQHLTPAYGTLVPYQAIYSPGGVYAHPSMAMSPQTPTGTLHGTSELNGKVTDGKEKASCRKVNNASKTHELIGNNGAKAMSGSGNDVSTQSAESGSENSSGASDDDDDDDAKQDFPTNKKGSFEQMLTDGANMQNNDIQANLQINVNGNSAVSVPATTLNMGMGFWNPSSADSGGVVNVTGVSPAGPSSMMNDRWIQDERELKRQKRKQSNRESARRSRLRKQAECEELQHKVEMLSNENSSLREELLKLSEECEKLASDNNSIKEELANLYGADTVSQLESSVLAARPQSHGNGDSS